MRSRPRHGRTTLRNTKINQKSQGIVQSIVDSTAKTLNDVTTSAKQSATRSRPRKERHTVRKLFASFYNVEARHTARKTGGSMTDRVKLTSMAKAAG
jgi:hypothetical protein